MKVLSVIEKDNHVKTKNVLIESLHDLWVLITNHQYYLGHFNNNYRSKENFRRLLYIGLDIDENLSLTEACERARKTDYKTVISTTRHHQKEKITGRGNVQAPCDRFRIIVELEGDGITSPEDFKPTLNQLLSIYPEADKGALDITRMFYPSDAIAYFGGSTLLKIIKAPTPEINSKKEIPSPLKNNPKGELSFITQRFLYCGAPKGQWHSEFIKVVTDFKSQNYSIEEAKTALSNVTGYLDNNDLYQIASIYNKKGNEFPFRKKENKNG